MTQQYRRAAVILNPIKVPDPDEFRRTVDEALTSRGFHDSLWLETTEDDAGHTMAKRAIQETVDSISTLPLLHFWTGPSGGSTACRSRETNWTWIGSW